MQFPWNEAPYNSALWLIPFRSNSLASAESWYSNIEREALGILHGLQKFHHSCFACKVSMITDHKPPVVIVKKYTVTLCIDQDPNYV